MGSPHQSVDIAEIDPPAQTATVHGKLHQSTPEQLHTLDTNVVTQSKAESLSTIEGSCQLSQVEASQQPAGTDKHPRSKMGHKGLRFLDKSLAGKGGWKTIEKRFDKSAVNGRLHKENFGPCIGMAESKEFAGKLFVALARRRNLDPEKGITKEELNEYWKGMTDQNFESRLRIFFDM